MPDDEPRVLERLAAELWAVHKPSGVKVHPGTGGGPDLVSWLDRQRDRFPPDTRPAHRIDVDASGAVLCGTAPARALVGGWIADGRVHRTYLVLVWGRTHKKGTIRRPLPDQRRGRPLPAITHYRGVERLGGFTLLEVRTETGRKHQVRRHLAGIGHPVVGDARRPPRLPPGRRPRVPGWPGRLWLHAWKLDLPGGRVIEDPLPAELQANLDALRAGLARAAAAPTSEE